MARPRCLWEVRRAPPDRLPLFAFAEAAELGVEPDAALPAMPLSEEVIADYQMTRLSLKAHPMRFLRADFAREGALSCADANTAPDGRMVKVAGIVLIRQRRARAMPYYHHRDKTGIVNACSGGDMERQRRAYGFALMLIEAISSAARKSRPPDGTAHLRSCRHARSAVRGHRIEPVPSPRTKSPTLNGPPGPSPSQRPNSAAFRDFH